MINFLADVLVREGPGRTDERRIPQRLPAEPLDKRNQRNEKAVRMLFLLMSIVLILPVLAILSLLIIKGAPAFSWEFFTEPPRAQFTEGGIFPALVGTLWLVIVALLASVPLGVAAAIYLSEYAKDNALTRLINLAIINLAGVPSIVHALFGLGAFVLFFDFGTSILAASLTLAIMTLPVVIVSTRETLQAVPQSFRWPAGASAPRAGRRSARSSCPTRSAAS